MASAMESSSTSQTSIASSVSKTESTSTVGSVDASSQVITAEDEPTSNTPEPSEASSSIHPVDSRPENDGPQSAMERGFQHGLDRSNFEREVVQVMGTLNSWWGGVKRQVSRNVST